MLYLLRFFTINSFKNKKFTGIAALCALPVVFTLLFIVLYSLFTEQEINFSALFPKISLLLYVHFLLPLVSLFLGSAVIGDEREEQTLSYLLTRPVPRSRIVQAKLFSSWVMLSVILNISLFFSYSILTIGSGISHWSSSLLIFIKSGAVLVTGAAVYLSLFALVGGLLKRPVVAGLFFIFGWEASVAFLPGKIKYATIVHYLHSLYPSLNQINNTQNLKANILNFIVSVKNISPLKSIIVLTAITGICIFAASLLLSIKEYRLDQNQ